MSYEERISHCGIITNNIMQHHERATVSNSGGGRGIIHAATFIIVGRGIQRSRRSSATPVRHAIVPTPSSQDDDNGYGQQPLYLKALVVVRTTLGEPFILVRVQKLAVFSAR